MHTQTYMHYLLTPQDDGSVTVFNPRSPTRPLFVADNLDKARRFVRGYRDGLTWAVMAAL